MPVHLRLNERDTSRNPHINFITALPGARHDESLRRLQQLSAMVQPLMREEGFHVNSLEEYEWNREFAGRNWNNGEVVELVLTTRDGTWMPLQLVLYVFCHELAHIRYMNHVPAQHGALTRKLKQMALDKQRQGYFGDGFWSSGRQLGQGVQRDGLGMHQHPDSNQLPSEVCGGAFRRASAAKGKRGKRRGASARRRGGAESAKRPRKFQGPSLHTGVQTSRNLKPGTAARRVEIRVEGTPESSSRVDGRNHLPTAKATDSSYKLYDNSTFRKRTQSREAREKRAMAAMARLGMQSGSSPALKKEAVQVKLETMMASGGSTASLRGITGIKEEVDRSGENGEGERTQSSSAKEESETEQESGGDSETEEEDDDGDDGDAGAVYISDDDLDGLVGDDLGEGRESGQTRGSRETEKQRQQLFERHRRRQVEDQGDNLREGWTDLLDEEGDRHERIHANPEVHNASSKKQEEEANEDNDEIELVGVQLAPQPMRQSVAARQAISSPATARNEEENGKAKQTDTRANGASLPSWTCQVCTLINSPSQRRCAACDTGRGRNTLGA